VGVWVGGGGVWGGGVGGGVVGVFAFLLFFLCSFGVMQGKESPNKTRARGWKLLPRCSNELKGGGGMKRT